MHIRVQVPRERNKDRYGEADLPEKIAHTYFIDLNKVALKSMPYTGIRSVYSEEERRYVNEDVYTSRFYVRIDDIHSKWVEIHEGEFNTIKLAMNKLNWSEVLDHNKKADLICAWNIYRHF